MMSTDDRNRRWCVWAEGRAGGCWQSPTFSSPVLGLHVNLCVLHGTRCTHVLEWLCRLEAMTLMSSFSFIEADVQLAQPNHWGKGNVNWGSSYSRLALATSVRDWLSWLSGSSIHWGQPHFKVVGSRLCNYRESKRVSSSLLRFLLEFLPWLSSTKDCHL